MRIRLIICLVLMSGVIHAAERDAVALLTSIRISEVKFKDATLGDVVSYLNYKVNNAAAELNDPDLNQPLFSSPKEVEANHNPAGADPKVPPPKKISINAKEILLGDLLKEVGRQSGVNVYITSEGVIFTTRKILKTVHEAP